MYTPSSLSNQINALFNATQWKFHRIFSKLFIKMIWKCIHNRKHTAKTIMKENRVGRVAKLADILSQDIIKPW